MARVSVLVCTALLTMPVAAPAQPSARDVRPVVVEGAMTSETEKLIWRLDNATVERVGGWTFWRGTVDGYPVIVSKTLKGVSNSAAATVIAVERYHPIAILNQGTAGGHDPGLHLYDIVLGVSAVNLGAFKSPYRAAGRGSNSLEWTPIDLMFEGSAGNNPDAHRVARFQGDRPLLEIARSVKQLYTRGRVVDGVIGTSDGWNDELDHMTRFHTENDTSVEEMETASAAQIERLSNTPIHRIPVMTYRIP